jgi:hypothetical protein
MTQINDLQGEVAQAAYHLYHIEGDVTPEQYRVISHLRQLLNECHDLEPQITNQFLYDQLKEIL